MKIFCLICMIILILVMVFFIASFIYFTIKKDFNKSINCALIFNILNIIFQSLNLIYKHTIIK